MEWAAWRLHTQAAEGCFYPLRLWSGVPAASLIGRCARPSWRATGICAFSVRAGSARDRGDSCGFKAAMTRYLYRRGKQIKSRMNYLAPILNLPGSGPALVCWAKRALRCAANFSGLCLGVGRGRDPSCAGVSGNTELVGISLDADRGGWCLG